MRGSAPHPPDDRRYPEQRVGFLEVDGARVAYATLGDGPPLLIPALWAGHLEREWAIPEYRAFATELAQDQTLIRYDRLGTGLSDRDVDPAALGVRLEVHTLERLVAELGLDELALLGVSFGGCTAIAFAAAHPTQVRALALVGAFANGAEIAPPDLRDAMLATVRAHWGAGSRMLADVWIPGADAAVRDAFALVQREGASPELAAELLEAVFRADVTELLPRIEAPTLVVHRRNDRAMPFALGRELAAVIPGARLVALDGDVHMPWLGDGRSVLDAVLPFLRGDEAAAGPAGAEEGPLPFLRGGEAAAESAGAEAGPLTDREREVLRLVAEGLSDGEIAERLVLSPHTVHRHVANIRTKLRQPSRAAAAAHAARLGLI